MGGHTVPEEVIRRRYDSGLRNFFKLYSPKVDSWQLYDNSDSDHLVLIALKSQDRLSIKDEKKWSHWLEKYNE